MSDRGRSPEGDAPEDVDPSGVSIEEASAHNARWWDATVDAHAKSAFYDVPGFLAGRDTLLPLERARVGDVDGQRLLHLQCHFGLDTLSWARRGATVVGVDISPLAIDKASALAAEAALDARATFVCRDVLTLADGPALGVFDVVFTSYGALIWLADLGRWAAGIARHLRPGGRVHVVECHPVAYMLDEASDQTGLRLKYPYRASAPIYDESEGTYAAPDAKLPVAGTYGWSHGLADVVQALLDNGLRLVHLSEHEVGPSALTASMARGEDGCYRLPPEQRGVPLVYALEALKP